MSRRSRWSGYRLHRQLTDLGHVCDVVGPTMIPKRSGDRVKTNRRDSVTLGKLLRAGELRVIWVPDTVHGAVRDLTRAREVPMIARPVDNGHKSYFPTQNWVLTHSRERYALPPVEMETSPWATPLPIGGLRFSPLTQFLKSPCWKAERCAAEGDPSQTDLLQN